MLTSQDLRVHLLRTLADPSSTRALRLAAARYPALADLHDGSALTAFLDKESPNSRTRDRVLADIVRWGRDTGCAAARAAAQLAFLPAADAIVKQLRAFGCRDRDRLSAKVLAEGAIALASYDPDKRSDHVLACVRLDVLRAVTRGWKRGQRSGPSPGEDVATWAATIGDSFRLTAEPWGEKPAADVKTRDILDDAAAELGTRLLAEQVDAGALSERDACLMRGLLLSGRTATDLGAEQGLDRRTVVRRVGRARSSIAEALRGTLQTQIDDRDARFADAGGYSWMRGQRTAPAEVEDDNDS